MAETSLICRKLKLFRREGLLLFGHIQEKSTLGRGARADG
jgi:hypothetical protein